MTKRPIAVDLFAGAGGMSLGFEWAGFDVLAAVEYDPIHCATHHFNFPKATSICRSVSDIDGSYLRKHSRIGDSEVAVVFGGAPCQGFSLIGKRLLEDSRNRLVFDFVRLVTDLQPTYFVFENVKGLTVGTHKRFLDELIEEFHRRGYEVRLPYKVLNAASYGVPQKRERLFLMGARKGSPLPAYPSSTHEFGRATDLDLANYSETPTVWDAIGDLPNADEYEELLVRDWILTRFAKPSPYARALRQKPKGEGKELLSSSLRTIHTKDSIRRFERTEHGRVEPISRFFKLDPNGLCNTLRAGTGSERGAFTSPRPIHPYVPRCITVREAARIHSYPDRFRFHVTKWHGFRQVGNSVPPLLARAVAMSVGRALGIETPRTNGALMDGEQRDISLLEFNMSEAAQWFGVPRDVIPARQRTADRAHA